MKVYVVKFDGAGNIEWHREIGGSKTQRGNQIIENSEGDYLIAGWSESTDGDFTGYNQKDNQNAFLMKLRKNGELDWLRTYSDSFGNALIQAKDGAVVMTGTTSSKSGDFKDINNNIFSTDDIFLVKVKM